MSNKIIGQGAFFLCAALALAGCEDGQTFSFLKPSEGSVAVEGDRPVGKMIERDIESPDVFQASEPGLWDGRPSLGGVWVAYPGIAEPERVMIRNQTNGKSVIGALFNRERENPGPKLTVSSDAAAALGLLAGAPTALQVVALRKELVPVNPPAPVKAEETPQAAPAPANGAITTQPIAPIAAAAIDKAEAKTKAGATTTGTTPPPAAPARDAAKTAPATAAKPANPAGPALAKPYIQIGIFNIEANANRTADTLRQNGILPTVLKQESSGKTFWRVIIGPLSTEAARQDLLKQAKGLGYSDAYFVSN